MSGNLKSDQSNDELEIKTEDENDTTEDSSSDFDNDKSDYESYDEIESGNSDNENESIRKEENNSSSNEDEDSDCDKEDPHHNSKTKIANLNKYDMKEETKEETNIVNFTNLKTNIKEEQTEKIKINKKKTKIKMQQKIASEKIGYVKPNVSLGFQHERKLSRQATRGVVQLFNVVRERQEFLAKKLAIIDKGSKAEKRKAIDEIKSFDDKKLKIINKKIDKNDEMIISDRNSRKLKSTKNTIRSDDFG